jgi:hypothetical protein
MVNWLIRLVVAVVVAFIVYLVILWLLVPLLGLIAFPIASIIAGFLEKAALVIALLVFLAWLFVGGSYWPLKGRTL